MYINIYIYNYNIYVVYDIYIVYSYILIIVYSSIAYLTDFACLIYLVFMSSFPTSLCGVLIFCWESAALLHPPASAVFFLSLSTCLYQLVSINLSLSTCLCHYQLSYHLCLNHTSFLSTCLYYIPLYQHVSLSACPSDKRGIW